MKTFRLIGMALLAVVMSINFTSCSDDDVMETPQRYTISLACAGEILDISDEPLTRANKSNIYEITVYADGAKYATGSFDSVENVTIDLVSGKTYSFKASYVIDSSQQPTNKFDYSVDTGGGAILPKYYYNGGGCYYGAIDKYTPEKNEKIEIYMKRMSFGLKLMASNLIDGASLKTIFKRNSYDSGHEEILTYNSPECDNLYSFSSNTWDEVFRGTLVDEEYVNYYETAILQLILKRTDGIEVNLGKYPIRVERNKKIYVKINVNENESISSKIQITLEEEDMTDGNQYEIDGKEGTITETSIVTE